MRILLFILIFTSVLGNSVAQQLRHWTHPDNLGIQYGGSIGYIGGSAGYNVFRNRAMTSIHYGHVPKVAGGPLNILAAKLLYIPKIYTLNDRITINPYDAGIMVSYHMGSDFQSDWPETRYPENYYWWQTSFRLHLIIQPSVTLTLHDHTMFKAVTGYLELNTNDLYLVSVVQNRHGLSITDIIKLGAGARFHF